MKLIDSEQLVNKYFVISKNKRMINHEWQKSWLYADSAESAHYNLKLWKNGHFEPENDEMRICACAAWSKFNHFMMKMIKMIKMVKMM